MPWDGQIEISICSKSSMKVPVAALNLYDSTESCPVSPQLYDPRVAEAGKVAPYISPDRDILGERYTTATIIPWHGLGWIGGQELGKVGYKARNMLCRSKRAPGQTETPASHKPGGNGNIGNGSVEKMTGDQI